MKKADILKGITVSLTKDGKTDFPERDIYLAYKEITGKPIGNWEWD